jgi:hypothetical protein
MNNYSNIPCEQRFAQQLIDVFNKDEILWNRLVKRREQRRKQINISEEFHKLLDIIDFEVMRQPDDCIGKEI